MTILSTSIDLSRLPAPNVVETLSFETILKEMRDDLVARYPAIAGVIDLESEPARKVLEVAAYREVGIRARVNDAARAVLLPFATGADLDQIAAGYGVQRLLVSAGINGEADVLESDERLRRRVQLAHEARSVAGPSGAYVFHALTAVPTLRDAFASSPEGGNVRVVLMADGEDPVPSDNDVNAVREALSPETVRPLTDIVTVAKVQPVDVEIVASLTLYPGPDASLVIGDAISQIEKHVERIRYIGFDLLRTAIFGRLHVDGVHSVQLSSPDEDVVVDGDHCVRVTGINITAASGRDE